VHGPVNLARLQQLIDLVDAPKLLFPPFTPGYPRQLVPGRPIFEQLRKQDVVIHQPFESFDGVLDFLREAVHDPQVLAIKQTIYRTGNDSQMMELLREAVRRGKEVTVVVELKARFDEEANINWAEALEAVGAQVVYGVVGLKTHAKMLLVTRREGAALVRYAHLSTGNYNPRTAQALHRHQPPHGRPAADRGRRPGVRAPGQPEQAAAPAPPVAGAVPPAAQADRAHRPGGHGRRRRAGRAHRAEDERADRRAADAGAGARRPARRPHRPDRARRLHAAGAGARA
jgi:hypothetical protein